MDTLKNLIVAKYQWIKTRYAGRGGDITYTPQNTNRLENYEFYNNGTVNYYENLFLKNSFNYTIDYASKVTGILTHSSIMIIATDKNTGIIQFHFNVYLCNDTAIFGNPFSSVTNISYYKRYH